MPFLELHVDGLDDLRAGFEEWKLRVGEAALEWVEKGTEIIADKAKEEFAGGSAQAPWGEPWRGPNFPRPTGHSNFLRNSIGSANVRKFPGGASGEVGPRTVYGRRIELGWTGTGNPNDPVGRRYTTRPFPFLKPGAEKATPELTELFNTLMREANEGG